MSMQRAEVEESERGLRPPTKMLVHIRIAGSTTEQFLQMAGAIAYRDKVAEQGIECAIDCGGYWVSDAIAGIAGEQCLESVQTRRLQFPGAYENIPDQSVIFPLENCRDVPRLSFAVNDFYGLHGIKRDYLWKRDCYAKTLGWHISRLAANRSLATKTGGIFLAMNFGNETPAAKAATDLWKKLIRWLDEINQPITIPQRFLSGDAKRCAMLYAYLPPDDSILQWACLLANCRLYIGPDCLLSQLAYSLRVPAIVLSELPANTHIDRHDDGIYADPMHMYCRLHESNKWSLENVSAKFSELERLQSDFS